jgi:hypothetical protein
MRKNLMVHFDFKDGARRLREAANKANYINALGILADPTSLLRHSIIKKCQS